MAVDSENDIDLDDASDLIHCAHCDMPLASRQEVEHALALLRHSGSDESALEERCGLLQSCPRCKSHRNAHSMRDAGVTRFLPAAKGK